MYKYYMLYYKKIYTCNIWSISSMNYIHDKVYEYQNTTLMNVR